MQLMIKKTIPLAPAELHAVEMRVKKSHVRLMRHPETALFAGCMMMGDTDVVDNPRVTAYTNGVDKTYGAQFITDKCKEDAELNALVLHENLHVALRHCILCKPLWNIDPRRAGMATDYVVNSIIVNLKDKTLCKLPEGGLYEDKYIDWSVRDVFNDLEEDCEGEEPDEPGDEGGDGTDDNPCDDGEPGDEEGGPNPGDKKGKGKGKEKKRKEGFDEHDFGGEASAEEQKDLNERVDRALREGALLAGRLGADIPRVISDVLTPKVDWRDAFRDFVTSACKGKDEYTWRLFNRRQLANDVYLPTVENETIGELVVAIDTSGSIGEEQLNEFAAELLAICETVMPERVRVLWWGTTVVGEQIFDDKDYEGLIKMLRPRGGGGTCAGSVSKYIIDNKITADAVVVFTDGYVEQPVVWETQFPTMWLVTMNKQMQVPAGGKMVLVQD